MHGDFLIQALVYLTAGVITVAAAKKLGLGSVLGYLIAGAVIGPFALNLTGEAEDVMKFAEFGVVILLFLIGLEVRPALLWSMRKTIFGLGGAQVVATALAIAGAAMLFGLAWPTALAAGLVLAMSSTAIVLQTLDEKGLRPGACRPGGLRRPAAAGPVDHPAVRPPAPAGDGTGGSDRERAFHQPRG